MFKASLSADLFKYTIQAIRALTKECRLHADEDRLHVLTVDSSNVAMIDLSLDSKAFTSYNSDGVELGLNLEKITGILKLIKDKNVYLEHDGNRLKIYFNGYEYSLDLLDCKTIRKDPAHPGIKLPVLFTVDGKVLYETIESAVSISSKMRVMLDSTSRVLALKAGDDDGQTIKRVITEPDIVIESDEGIDANSLFSLDYLKDIGKIIRSADNIITVKMGIDVPIDFVFSYADSNGTIEYLLAPRIEQE